MFFNKLNDWNCICNFDLKLLDLFIFVHISQFNCRRFQYRVKACLLFCIRITCPVLCALSTMWMIKLMC